MYNHLIHTFIDAQTAAHRHYSAVCATEQKIFGAIGEPALKAPCTHEVIAELRRAYNSLADRIIMKARREFSNGAAMPVVSRRATFLRAGFDIERALTLGEVPDFDHLWHVVQAQLSGINLPSGESR
jgi:acyl-CoA reductase-like NAD-dependent aldehyde dehydrogenase